LNACELCLRMPKYENERLVFRRSNNGRSDVEVVRCCVVCIEVVDD
jgi:hypothetical protein